MAIVVVAMVTIVFFRYTNLFAHRGISGSRGDCAFTRGFGVVFNGGPFERVLVSNVLEDPVRLLVVITVALIACCCTGNGVVGVVMDGRSNDFTNVG